MQKNVPSSGCMCVCSKLNTVSGRRKGESISMITCSGWSSFDDKLSIYQHCGSCIYLQ